VELGDNVVMVRSIAGVDLAVAIGWPKTSVDWRQRCAVLLQPFDQDLLKLKVEASSGLADYVAPKDIKKIEKMPLDQNGRVGRKAQSEFLEREETLGRM